jgi:hypothetical protein
MTRSERPYSKEEKENIADSFLDIMLHEVFGLPAAVQIDFPNERLSFSPLPADATPLQHHLYAAVRNGQCQTVTALMSTIGKACPNHACLPALRFLTQLHDREGLAGVADFLLRNLPNERSTLKRLTLDAGERKCLLEEQTRQDAARYTRRSFLYLTSVIPAIGLIATAFENKQRIKHNLYRALAKQPEADAAGNDPRGDGVTLAEFMAGTTRTRIPLTVNFQDGVTTIDLSPLPLPIPPERPERERVYINVNGRLYRFPHNAHGLALQDHYAWAHQFVQPLGVLAAAVSLGMAVAHAGSFLDINIQRTSAAKGLVEPFCRVFSGVMNAMDAPSESATRHHER